MNAASDDDTNENDNEIKKNVSQVKKPENRHGALLQRPQPRVTAMATIVKITRRDDCKLPF